jgi:hypothetical protein
MFTVLFTIQSGWFEDVVISTHMAGSVSFICLCNKKFRKLLHRFDVTISMDPDNYQYGKLSLIRMGNTGKRMSFCVVKRDNIRLSSFCCTSIAHSYVHYISQESVTTMGLPLMFGERYFDITHVYVIAANLMDTEIPRYRLGFRSNMEYLIYSCLYPFSTRAMLFSTGYQLSGTGIIRSLHKVRENVLIVESSPRL